MTSFDPAHLILPPEDREISPITGWARAHWAAVADHLLLSLRPYASPAHSRVLLPGITGGQGRDSDGLEGFARSFLLFAFRMRGDGGADPLGFTEWYREGLLAGCAPDGPERWPSPSDVGQAKVEAASIVVGLQLTRPWLWDTLSAEEQRSVVGWLAEVPHGEYPDNNWRWFRITVETFLAAEGGPHDPRRIEADLTAIESYYRGDGWYADGPLRSFDHYCGWAMHLYPLLWAHSPGADLFGASRLEPAFRERLGRYLDDAIHLVGGDGLPLLQGRSLIYRFAAAAPLWMGALTGSGRLRPGVIRRAASGMLRAFVERGAVDHRGLLSVGLFGAWPAMAQSYSGSSSPYWATKGFLGLALPGDHEVWTAREEPLPVEVADVRRVIRPAGWIVSGTAADGIVRVVNHGTDHGSAGLVTADAPLYTRMAYSTATLPPLVGATVSSPVDNSVGAVDPHGRLTHRSGFTREEVGDDGLAAFAGSTARTHWVAVDESGRDLGSGREGAVTEGPTLRTMSLVRGPWEVRVVRRLHGEDPGRSVRLRVSGWPLTDTRAAPALNDSARVTVRSGDAVSELLVLRGEARTGVHAESGTSPLGAVSSIPWAEFDRVEVDEVVVIAVRLGRADPPAPPRVTLQAPEEGTVVGVVEWPGVGESRIRV
ncbi:DUF2264 domain-containing protein [Cnuibacter sp. UC19_7]|uniref:DUF2264 domain-containing protein n=1 Tax=Cnuibacter sp. UC19_7 TaxID=3350166 RepID=UPI00366F567B